MSTLNAGETLQPFKPLRNNLIFDSSGNLVGIQNDRANGNDFRIGGGSGVDGTFATLVATTALKINSGGTFDLYNTADQTVNYERLRAYWISNVAGILMQHGGSASPRALLLGVSGSGNTYQFASSQSSATAHQIGAIPNASSGPQVVVGITPTFNQSGTASYTVLDVNPTETATGSGSKLLQRWAVGGVAVATITNAGFLSANNLYASGSFNLSGSFGSAQDVTLTRDAADTLALRRDANAQTFRVYNTYTDASNGEWGFVRWVANEFLVGNSFNGTGVVRPMSFQIANVTRWTINTSGNFIAGADNTYDIGASGANRPRNVYIGGSTVIGAFHTVGVSTVAALPAAAGAARAQIFVSDSSVAAAGNFGAIVVGGGANIVPVFCDGTNWRIG